MGGHEEGEQGSGGMKRHKAKHKQDITMWLLYILQREESRLQALWEMTISCYLLPISDCIIRRMPRVCHQFIWILGNCCARSPGNPLLSIHFQVAISSPSNLFAAGLTSSSSTSA